MITFQCELTAKDAELAVAVEHLQHLVAQRNFHPERERRIRLWLKRNTPQESSDAGSVLQQTEG